MFNVFGFLPVDSIARIVSRQSFELAKEELLNLKKVALPQEIKTLLNSDLKKKEQTEWTTIGKFAIKTILYQNFTFNYKIWT